MSANSKIPFVPWLVSVFLMPAILTVIQVATDTINAGDILNFFFSFLFVGAMLSAPALASLEISRLLFTSYTISRPMRLLLTSLIAMVLTCLHYLFWFRGALLNIEGAILFGSYLLVFVESFCLHAVWSRPPA